MVLVEVSCWILCRQIRSMAVDVWQGQYDDALFCIIELIYYYTFYFPVLAIQANCHTTVTIVVRKGSSCSSSLYFLNLIDIPDKGPIYILCIQVRDIQW